MHRELYGRGLIGSLKATTWWQQLQEKQNKAAQQSAPLKDGVRVQAGPSFMIKKNGKKWHLIEGPQCLDGKMPFMSHAWKYFSFSADDHCSRGQLVHRELSGM